MSAAACTKATLYYNSEEVAEAKTNGSVEAADNTTVPVIVPIHNARGNTECTCPFGKTEPLKIPTLDNAGFELVKQVTSVPYEQFRDALASPTSKKALEAVYFDEIAALICHVTGATSCRPMHLNVRSASADDQAKKKKDGPAMAIHCDYTVRTALTFFDGLKPSDMKTGRFMVINAWRNIGPKPIQNHHLACCDASTIVSPDDFIPFNWRNPSTGDLNQTYRMDPGHHHDHRWYYYPNMTRDEVLLFTQYDSDPKKSCRYTFHTAFEDKTAPHNAPFRESIEVRTVAFFPNAPNSVPALLQTGNMVARELGRRALAAVAHFDGWDAQGQQWAKHTLWSGPHGVEQLLRGVLKEHIGENARGNVSKEDAEAAIQTILKAGDFERAAKEAVPGQMKTPLEAARDQIVTAVSYGRKWDAQGRKWAKETISKGKSGLREFVTGLVAHNASPGEAAKNEPLKLASPDFQRQVVEAVLQLPTFEQQAREAFL